MLSSAISCYHHEIVLSDANTNCYTTRKRVKIYVFLYRLFIFIIDVFHNHKYVIRHNFFSHWFFLHKIITSFLYYRSLYIIYHHDRKNFSVHEQLKRDNNIIHVITVICNKLYLRCSAYWDVTKQLDIDECSNESFCGKGANSCTNTIGSFNCSCKPG